MGLFYKGQVAYEYLVLLSIALLLITPMIIFSLNTASSQRTANDGEIAMSRIAAAAESVYAQGVGAKQTVTVYIPESSNLAGSTISGRLLRLRVYSGEGNPYDIVRIFPFNVTGSLPLVPGYQEIAIETLTSGIVQIGSPTGSSGPVCGNGIREGNESCDGSDLGGATCLTVPGGFVGGTLSCTGACTYDTSACFVGTIFYVSSTTSHNGSVNNFADMQSASDGGKHADLTEQQFPGGVQQSLALDADSVVESGTWTTVSNTFTSNDLKATTTAQNDRFNVSIANTGGSGTIGSVVAHIEQNIVDLSGSDGFDIIVGIGGTYVTACNDVVGTLTDSYLSCNITNSRPGGGTWSFSDINDTRINIVSHRQGAAPTSWNVDHVQLAINYTPPSVYTMNITTDFTGVTLGGTAYVLEVRYNVTSDTFHVAVWNGTVFNTRTDLLGNNLNSATSTTWSYTMTAAELNGGSPKIRFYDATPEGANQGSLKIDYERIVRTG